MPRQPLDCGDKALCQNSTFVCLLGPNGFVPRATRNEFDDMIGCWSVRIAFASANKDTAQLTPVSILRAASVTEPVAVDAGSKLPPPPRTENLASGYPEPYHTPSKDAGKCSQRPPTLQPRLTEGNNDNQPCRCRYTT